MGITQFNVTTFTFIYRPDIQNFSNVPRIYMYGYVNVKCFTMLIMNKIFYQVVSIS